jgi:hypothetical protein
MSKNKNTIGQQIITDAATHIRKSQYKIQNEQNTLAKKISLFQKNDKYSDFTFDNLSKLVIKKFEIELSSIDFFNKAISSNKQDGCNTGFGVRTNKLFETLTGAEKLATNTNISNVLNGKFIKGFDNSIGDLPVLGEKGAYWGTSNTTFATTFLKVIHSTIPGKNITDTANSATLHTFLLPEKFDTSLVKSSIFIELPEKGAPELTIPNSGYSYGGDRLNKKEFKPQDCTSFLEVSAQLTQNGASSADLYLAKRVLAKQGLVVVKNDWLDSAGGSMVKLFDLNTDTPQPGDIWARRKFNDKVKIDSSLGFGGHAGIYLGQEKDKIVNLAYNRDMPDMEGFGLEKRVFEKNSKTNDQFWLTRNKKDFVLSGKSYPFKDLSDLVGLTKYIDDNLEKENEISLLGLENTNEE